MSKTERVCRYCGGEALPIEENKGRVCEECFTWARAAWKRASRARHHGAAPKPHVPCSVCGKPTRRAEGVCWHCQKTGRKKGFDPFLRLYPDYDLTKDSEIARWNRDHPFVPYLAERIVEALAHIRKESPWGGPIYPTL